MKIITALLIATGICVLTKLISDTFISGWIGGAICVGAINIYQYINK